MNRIVVTLAAAAAVGVVAVPVALAEGGTPGQRRRHVETGGHLRADVVRGPDHARRHGRRRRAPGFSETGRPLVVRLTDDTVVKQGDAVAGVSALTPGQRARFLVRACRSDDRKVLTALVIFLAKKAETAPPGTETTPSEPKRDAARTPTPEPPKPSQETCGQGELNTVLVAVSSSSITVRTTSSEGTKEWSVAITGDTVVRKNDQTVPASSLKAGDTRARRARAVPFGLRAGAEDRRASGLRTGLRGRGGAALRRPVARVAFSRHGGFIAAGRHPNDSRSYSPARP